MSGVSPLVDQPVKSYVTGMARILVVLALVLVSGLALAQQEGLINNNPLKASSFWRLILFLREQTALSV